MLRNCFWHSFYKNLDQKDVLMNNSIKEYFVKNEVNLVAKIKLIFQKKMNRSKMEAKQKF